MEYCHNTSAASYLGDARVMFEIQDVDLPKVSTPALVMFDGCSSAVLIRHEYAKLAGYKGTPVQYVLKSTGHPGLKRTTLSLEV